MIAVMMTSRKSGPCMIFSKPGCRFLFHRVGLFGLYSAGAVKIMARRIFRDYQAVLPQYFRRRQERGAKRR
jgi:hypothetical protein